VFGGGNKSIYGGGMGIYFDVVGWVGWLIFHLNKNIVLYVYDDDDVCQTVLKIAKQKKNVLIIF
jgi:hypothetical protein